MSTRDSIDEVASLIVTPGRLAVGIALVLGLTGVMGLSGLLFRIPMKLTVALMFVAGIVALALMRRFTGRPKRVPVIDLMRGEPARIKHVVGITRGAGVGGSAAFLALAGADGRLLVPAVRLFDSNLDTALAHVRAALPGANVTRVDDTLGVASIARLVRKAATKP